MLFFTSEATRTKKAEHAKKGMGKRGLTKKDCLVPYHALWLGQLKEGQVVTMLCSCYLAFPKTFIALLARTLAKPNGKNKALCRLIGIAQHSPS